MLVALICVTIMQVNSDKPKCSTPFRPLSFDMQRVKQKIKNRGEIVVL